MAIAWNPKDIKRSIIEICPIPRIAHVTKNAIKRIMDRKTRYPFASSDTESHILTASVTAVNSGIMSNHNPQVIGIRMTNAMLTNSFHHSTIIPEMLRKVAHIMV